MTSTLSRELQKLIKNKFSDNPLSQKFLNRINERKLTRDENPLTHFGVYFAGFDHRIKEVFVGLHKKADLWLFNGGHVDRGETSVDTLEREMGEEWGFVHPAAKAMEPSLLTITEITNDRQICRLHYDVWYFVPVDKTRFSPDKSKLLEEFHENRWCNLAAAKKLITDSNTLIAIDQIESMLS